MESIVQHKYRNIRKMTGGAQVIAEWSIYDEN
jgi:hypothetical protein